eukprot:2133039-Alexandrium_andersonii.AAC.1
MPFTAASCARQAAQLLTRHPRSLPIATELQARGTNRAGPGRRRPLPKSGVPRAESRRRLRKLLRHH